MDRLAREDLAASYEDSDRNPPVFDPKTNTAPLPESFKKSYQAWQDAEYWRLQLNEELGGTPAPSSLIWALGELVLGANAPIWMYGAGPTFAGIVHRNGNDRDKQIAQHIVDQRLEHHDGAHRARRRLRRRRRSLQGHRERRRHLEHHRREALHHLRRASDLTENVIHLVLARPQGIEGVGGPGTKGLSLFIVPKFHFDHETGELTGERNGAYVTNVEHKMGIKVSNTCELTFGDSGVGGGEPARAGCSARCTTASRRCSRSSRTPG